MGENCHSNVYNWLHDNLESGSLSEFVDLIEIRSKLSAEVEVEVTNLAIGNLVKNIFTHINVKNGRSKSDWGKLTKRYYGLMWKEKSSTDAEFCLLMSEIPDDFIMLSKNLHHVTIGYFRNIIINGMKVLTEATLNADSTWHLTVMGRKIDPTTIGIDSTFKLPVIYQIIRQLGYCDGVKKIDDSKAGQIFFKEHTSLLGDENSDFITYGSKKCIKVLPIKSSNKTSSSCYFCKYLEKPVKETKTKIIDEQTNNEQISNAVSTNTEDDLVLKKNDNDDLSLILDKIFPECSDKMKSFLLSQKMANERNPRGRRWNRDIIRLCLTLWCRSNKGYKDLRNSKFLILPSEKLLQRFKNNVHQEAGINHDMLHWMANEAKLKNLPPEGFEGGLIIDEMSIQPDLQFKKKNGEIELIGFTEMLPESLVFEQMKSNKKERILATHVLQLVFLGTTGFRFPFAHFPSTTASEHELYLLMWKSVNMLLNFGFKILYLSTDGAQTNRDLFKLLLPDFRSVSPITCSFKNVYARSEQICFIMDYSHVIKKIRNNISKSGTETKRHLKLGNHFIEWNHFRRAYLWEISTHPFPVHQKLSQEHIYLTSEQKCVII